MKLFLSPHSDDETLFGAFTIIRERPHVVICYPSVRDYGETEARLTESKNACQILGAASCGQLHQRAYPDHLLDDLFEWWQTSLQGQGRGEPIERLWIPHERATHREHLELNRVGREFGERMGCPISTYHTYENGHKVREGARVHFDPSWLYLKLKALACYQSQIQHPRASRFFADDLYEWEGGDL